MYPPPQQSLLVSFRRFLMDVSSAPRPRTPHDWDKVAVGIYNDGPRSRVEFYRVPRKLDPPRRDLSRRPLSSGILNLLVYLSRLPFDDATLTRWITRWYFNLNLETSREAIPWFHRNSSYGPT